MLTNNEIVTLYLDSGLIQECVDYQFLRLGDSNFKEDYFQDLVLELLTYDNSKMNDAHSRGHFNALVTRIIQNNIYSKTSRYYKKYKRFDLTTQEITNKELMIEDEN